MADTFGNFDVTLTATNASLFTSINPSVIILAATALNTDSVARTITLSRNLSATGVTTELIDGAGSAAYSLGPGQTSVLPLTGFVFNVSDSLLGFASAASVVNISLNYVIANPS